jgi:hypothetical protein
LRNVRNVVAAWRGGLPTPRPVMSFDTPALRGDDERKGKGNVFEEAFFTIRRMSTRRRNKQTSVGLGGGEKEGKMEKPLPAVVDSDALLRDVRGREGIKADVVSAMTEMTSDVRPFSFLPNFSDSVAARACRRDLVPQRT